MAGSDEETMADNSMYVNKSQKVIISDLLFYIWNRLMSDPKDDIVDACVSFYANKDDYVRQEKEKFFASISETSNFDISAVHGPIVLCFGYDAPVGVCYLIFRAYGPITRFRVDRGPST